MVKQESEKTENFRIDKFMIKQENPMIKQVNFMIKQGNSLVK